MATAASDTIVAIATPPGTGAVGIVRLSGPAARAVADAISGRRLRPREATLTAFRDAAGRVIDQGLALFFPAPASYTGEDCLELHAHGGAVVLDMLVERVLELGARPARPGEFTERAFLNGKLDLAQAEAVADLIACGTRRAARAAGASLRGAFSEAITGLGHGLMALRVQLEAALDFPEDDTSGASLDRLAAGLEDLCRDLRQLRTLAQQGCILSEGVKAAILGRPNVGKSSLLNALAGHERAIVTDVPGTTRDTVEEVVNIDGLSVRLTDTAGLRDSGDAVEREGMRRARIAREAADQLLLVAECGQVPNREELDMLSQMDAQHAVTLVYNKIDLHGENPRRLQRQGYEEVWVSALTGQGLTLLKRRICDAAGAAAPGGGEFSARRRQLAALGRAAAQLSAARETLTSATLELCAEHLRLAHGALQEILGKVTTEDLLAEIFANFCIGK